MAVGQGTPDPRPRRADELANRGNRCRKLPVEPDFGEGPDATVFFAAASSLLEDSLNISSVTIIAISAWPPSPPRICCARPVSASPTAVAGVKGDARTDAEPSQRRCSQGSGNKRRQQRRSEVSPA